MIFRKCRIALVVSKLTLSLVTTATDNTSHICKDGFKKKLAHRPAVDIMAKVTKKLKKIRTESGRKKKTE